MGLRRVTLGAACAAMYLANTCALLPAGSLSGSACRPAALKHCYSTSSLRGGSAGGTGGVAAGTSSVGTVMNGGEHDLYVVGAGYLGKLIGAAWHAKHPSAKMYGETRSYTRHEGSMPTGMTHLMRKNREEKGVRCPNLVFCANPAGNDDYAREVFTAMTEMWDGTGMFVFTSSGSVYAEKDGGVVNEDSPLADSARASPLRTAERVCLDAGGCVVRLAGLYSVERGPHSVWLEETRLNKHSQGLINLIAYEDAAAAVVAALDAGLPQPSSSTEASPEIKGRVFLAADGVPTSRQDICKLAMLHPRHSRKSMPKFVYDEGLGDLAGIGATKIYDTSLTRRDLGWEPRYASMAEYFKAAAAEEEDGEEEGGKGEEERVPAEAA